MKVFLLVVSEGVEEERLRAQEKGAQTLLLEDGHAARLLQAVQAALHQIPVPASALDGVYDNGHFPPTKEGEEASRLSLREEEILALVAEGLTNKEIARRVYITENTVKYHVRKVLPKLRLKNRAQVIAWASLHRARPLALHREPVVC